MALDVSDPCTEAGAPSDPSSTPSTPSSVKQRTLKSSIGCSGVGLHSGVRVAMKLHPAPVNSGIVFKRIDLVGGGSEIPALWHRIADSRMCTVLAADNGISVATVEHLMAAFYGMGIDNALVELNGPEVPAMDGSAAPFIFLMECAGTIEQKAQRKTIRIKQPVVYRNGPKEVGLAPAVNGLRVDFEIQFSAPAVGRQYCSFEIDREVFKSEISKSRTFGFLSDVTALREAGLARGGSLENAIVVDCDRILNEDGLRHANEFVRHKALDAVGDLYLTGYPMLGHFHGVCSSHADTANLLRKVLTDETNWELVDAPVEGGERGKEVWTPPLRKVAAG